MRKKQAKPVKAEQLNSYYEESRGLERELISEFLRSCKMTKQLLAFL